MADRYWNCEGSHSMTLQHIRDSRGVPVKRGMRVRYTGGVAPKYGTVIGAKHGYVRIRIDGEKNAGSYHPTWELEYFDSEGVKVWPV